MVALVFPIGTKNPILGVLAHRLLYITVDTHWWSLSGGLRTFARKFSNIDFFLKILPLKDDDLVMSEM